MAVNLGLEFTSGVADGGIAHVLDTENALTSGLLLSVRNQGTQKLSVDYNGVITAGGFAGPATGLTSIPAAQLTGTVPLGSIPTIDHGSLDGKDDDDHTQYVHLTIARSIQAQHTFAPGVAQAPFLLGANAQGALVAGLNADLLDGQEGSYYRNADNLNAGNVPIARFPTGGNWDLASDLLIRDSLDATLLHIDEANKRVGFGRVPSTFVDVDGDVRIRGSVTIDGPLFAVEAETFQVADNIFVLNSNVTGTPTEDGGLEVERGTEVNAALKWIEGADYWAAGLVGSEVQIVTVNTAPALTGTNFTGIPETAIADGALLARVGDPETITGAWTFNRGAGTPPFILHANAQGQKVIGLDADLLDDQEGAYYLALANATGTLAAGNIAADLSTKGVLGKGALPSFGTEGRIWWDTGTGKVKRDTGAAWEDFPGGVDDPLLLDALQVDTITDKAGTGAPHFSQGISIQYYQYITASLGGHKIRMGNGYISHYKDSTILQYASAGHRAWATDVMVLDDKKLYVGAGGYLGTGLEHYFIHDTTNGAVEYHNAAGQVFGIDDGSQAILFSGDVEAADFQITGASAPLKGLGTYTPTNVTTSRSFDADTVTLAELADIVGTLIADFQSGGVLA